MDAKYAKYYKNFKPPPFAPTYRPTEAEFVDPIEFVQKIKLEAEKYGIVKIKPPKSFQPPFAIKSEDFIFTPRVQKLNEIDGLFRLRLLFEAELSTFWELQGHILNSLSIDGKTIDLYKLSKLVAEKGGFDHLTLRKKWGQVGKYFSLTSQCCSQLKSLYCRWVLPFEQCIEEIEQEKRLGEKLDEGCVNSIVQDNYDTNNSESTATELTNEIKSDSVDDVVCKRCRKGDDEERLLLCEDCNAALHTYCCDPPLTYVPETEWRCYGCVKSRVKSIGDNFGFHESHEQYNLITFAEYANMWKRDYFGKNIFDTTQEEVEKEFWRKVADVNSETSVKYGADLSASKVGSGFPAFTKGIKKRNMSDCEYHYAKHPWNLNNMPILKGSVLSHISSGISGMMVPWVYIGMCFATFCWHTEDHWMYSINYLHWGERKIWYGVPGFEGDKFDEIVNTLVPDLFRKSPDLLHHLTTIINPMILKEHGINVYTVHQEPGEFVITFPHAYHSGFNEGLNCAEAVNFAPYDWLIVGRLCVNDYARVHRKCVFSHDELIVSMVRKINDLDMPTKVALYDELEKLLLKEEKWRSLFPESKHRYERTKFELIHDDHRECVFCKSTLYLSALECKHAKLACLMHAEKLCNECEVKDYYVKYRYSVEELLAMKEEVALTINYYIKWKEKAAKLFNKSEKPNVEDFREVLKLASLKQIPSCELLMKINGVVKDCEFTCIAVDSLLQKLSSRSIKRDYDTIMKLNAQVEALPCTISENLSDFYSFVNRLNDWKERVGQLLEVVLDEVENYDKIIEEAEILVTEGDNYDVQLPELGELKKLLNLTQWMKVAKGLLSWRNSCDDSELTSDADFLTMSNGKMRQRWTLKAVEKLVDDGISLMRGSSQVQRMVDEVHACMKLGWNREFAAEKILIDEENKGGGITKVNEVWEKFRVCNWLSMEKLDDLRLEIVKAKNVYELYTESKGRCDLTSANLQMYSELCEQSFFMNGSSLHKEILRSYTALKHFMKQINMIFAISTHPSALHKILCNDLNSEERVQSFNARNVSSDGWNEIEAFGSSSELVKHLEFLRSEFHPSLIKLRKKNEKQMFCSSCKCHELKVDEEFLKCCLCYRKIHASCAKWNDFLYYLPFGYYLCSYCHQGRRPVFHEIECFCRCAPPSLAKVSVEFVLQNCLEVYKEAANVFSLMEREININSSLLLRFERSLLRVLSSAIIDPETLKKISSKLPLIQKPTKMQVLAMKTLQFNKFRTDLPSNLSALGLSRKRSHSVEVESASCSNGKKTRKYKLVTPY